MDGRCTLTERAYSIQIHDFSAAQMCLAELLVSECSAFGCLKKYRGKTKRAHWAKIRCAREAYVGRNLCELCLKENWGTNQHHRTYERIGDEHLDDVIFLCPACHSYVHIEGKRKAAKHE